MHFFERAAVHLVAPHGQTFLETELRLRVDALNVERAVQTFHAADRHRVPSGQAKNLLELIENHHAPQWRRIRSDEHRPW
jgi:hypothetical protein